MGLAAIPSLLVFVLLLVLVLTCFCHADCPPLQQWLNPQPSVRQRETESASERERLLQLKRHVFKRRYQW